MVVVLILSASLYGAVGFVSLLGTMYMWEERDYVLSVMAAVIGVIAMFAMVVTAILAMGML